jgi:L-alanine-DL-glutamate epimerase-like enolase superfamily enzyme
VSSKSLQILSFDLYRHDVRLRMPFRYGIATMTEGPVVFVRLRVDDGGREVSGIASDLLPPKWFTKIPDKPIAEEIDELLRVILHASQTAVGLRGENAFEIWRQLYEAQAAWGQQEKLPALLWNFGVSLVERALIEAVARSRGSTFSRLLREGALGLRLDSIHPELRGRSAAELLTATPNAQVIVRHTIGLADPLVEADIPPSDRLKDGLPQSLGENIRAYGLRHFKIKLFGDTARDLARLESIAAVLAEHCREDYAFSLDGNENFKSVEPFREFWDEATRRGPLRAAFARLLFVEQPLHRDAALRPEVGEAFSRWPERPPMIIDESDGAPEDLRTALHIGYAGTSHKNCKGIFKGVAHRCFLRTLEIQQPARRVVMSGEDLCNIGPVALLQDLAAMATLGIESIERNGHHYHAGLSQFPEAVREQILEHHPDLYVRSPGGWPTLRIEGGRLNLASINAAPFGVGFELAVGSFKRI